MQFRIRDLVNPRSGIKKVRSGILDINIPDTKHWRFAAGANTTNGHTFPKFTLIACVANVNEQKVQRLIKSTSAACLRSRPGTSLLSEERRADLFSASSLCS
jgi:hypothetical protein